LGSRKSITISNVTTSFTEQTLTGFPDKFAITRVAAEILSGSGTTVAVAIRQRAGATSPEHVVLEYDLVSTFDYVENALVQSYKVRDSDLGSIYVAAKCDAGTDNSIRITLEYEL